MDIEAVFILMQQERDDGAVSDIILVGSGQKPRSLGGLVCRRVSTRSQQSSHPAALPVVCELYHWPIRRYSSDFLASSSV
jgi:hypothetical protein